MHAADTLLTNARLPDGRQEMAISGKDALIKATGAAAMARPDPQQQG
jgi:hypothetical protein